LGNVPDADIPIPNLRKEDVIVTKLVYADELPPPEVIAPKPAPKPAAKKTNNRIAVDTA
jgi:hypothetical protein